MTFTSPGARLVQAACAAARERGCPTVTEVTTNQEDIMADSATQERPAAVKKYVLDALNKNGHKFRDLPDATKKRATDAPDLVPDLRGKALAAWITETEAPAEEPAPAAAPEPTEEEALRAELAELQEKGSERGWSAREAKRMEAIRKALGETAAGEKKPAASAKYPEEVRAAVKRSNAIRGSSHGAGPKQHAHIRMVVVDQIKGAATVAKLVELSGFDSVAALFSVASGEGDRTATKPLRPLAEKMGDDPWCKGRHLAAALAAWCEELQEGK